MANFLAILIVMLLVTTNSIAQSTQPIENYRGPTTRATYAGRVVGPISDQMRRDLSLPGFYSKTIEVRGIPIISSDKASDYALLECAYVLDHMIGESPEWVHAALTRGKVRMGVMSVVEYTMDIPEHRYLGETDKKAAFWDERARGLGGLPMATCAEENLLNFRSDPYRAENITIHEFSHTLASAIKEVNPEWYDRLVKTYKKSIAAGKFASSYSAQNEQEYWAEGVQAWFNCAAPFKDATVHSGIWHRNQLKEYDAELSQMLAEVFGDGDWRYIRTDGKPLVVEGQSYTRTPEDLSHLQGLDRPSFPSFSFAKSNFVRRAKPATQPAK